MDVQGVLKVTSNTRIVTPSIVVGTEGALEVGTPEAPVSDVEIYLQHADCQALPDGPEKSSCLESGRLVSFGKLNVHGTPKTPWSLLVEDCDGCATLAVSECEGWAPGDRLAVSATGGRAMHYMQLVYARDFDAQDNFEAGEGVIASVSAAAGGRCAVTLEEPLRHLHRGSWMAGGRVPVQAEVANLNRSVLITGPPIHWIDASRPVLGGQGLVTAQMFGGTMQISHAKVENCGRIAVGRYCLHFHVLRECPTCSLIGNVVERGVNKGITVHGTHQATVDRNVVYDLRGASLYIEDGNEKDNTLSNNVLMCPSLSNGAPIGNLAQDGTGNHKRGRRCHLDGVPGHRDSDFNEQSGIYALSPSNHIIGNRVSGHENAMFVNHQGGGTYGLGRAAGRSCVTSLPFGRTEGNVFHNNAGFGWYVNVAFPTDVVTDDDGMTADWSTCLPFDMATGAENGKGFVVKNHLEYFNDFAMGTYDLGDVTFEDTISALNNKGLYWKTYRRGANSGPFAKNLSFVDNVWHLEGPGGSGVVEFDGLDLVTSPELAYLLPAKFILNHHCALPTEQTGGLCASHYVLRMKDGLAAPMSRERFYSEAKRSDAVILFGGASQFLKPADGGYKGALPTFRTDECAEAGDWLVCDGMDDVRVVRIYSPDRGDLRVTADGVTTAVPFLPFSRGKRQGHHRYRYTLPCNPPGSGVDCDSYIVPFGYTFLVRGGANVAIDIPTSFGPGVPLYDLFTVEYADAAMTPTTSISLSVTGDARLAGGPCTVSSTHSRAYITPYGPLLPQSGAWWDCREWPTRMDSGDFMTKFDTIMDYTTARRCSSSICAGLDATSPVGRVVLDSLCPGAGGVGCAIGGEPCCRLCDADGYSTCDNRSVRWVGTS